VGITTSSSFVAIVEAGSLTLAAARKLLTSQPSLSWQIRDLEDEVGAQTADTKGSRHRTDASGSSFSRSRAGSAARIFRFQMASRLSWKRDGHHKSGRRRVSELNATVRFRVRWNCPLFEHDNLWTNS
jgi:DNA-binding transcriptional LysR family regulator